MLHCQQAEDIHLDEWPVLDQHQRFTREYGGWSSVTDTETKGDGVRACGHVSRHSYRLRNTEAVYLFASKHNHKHNHSHSYSISNCWHCVSTGLQSGHHSSFGRFTYILVPTPLLFLSLKTSCCCLPSLHHAPRSSRPMLASEQSHSLVPSPVLCL